MGTHHVMCEEVPLTEVENREGGEEDEGRCEEGEAGMRTSGLQVG